jgi:PD-(D/E)XK nuclease superfamily
MTTLTTETQSHRQTENQKDLRTAPIIGAAIKVHRHLGPGLLESAYEECLCHELHLRGLSFERQVDLPVSYKGLKLDCGSQIDLIVEQLVVLELQSDGEDSAGPRGATSRVSKALRKTSWSPD